MITLCLIFIILTLTLTYSTWCAEHDLKFYVIFSFVVYFYYCIGGVYYWMDYLDGTFLGVDWIDYRSKVLSVFTACYIFTLLVVLYTYKLFHFKNTINANPVLVFTYNKTLHITLTLIGILASLYVLIRSGSDIDIAGIHDADPLLLIMTQSADFIIPSVLFGLFYSKAGRKFWIIIFLYFIFYATYVGYRNKLLILLAPILYLFLYKNNISFIKKLSATLGLALLLMVFSVMTIARKKFGGFDWYAVSNINLDELMFGFFAETNIIFGLGSVLEVFGSKVAFAGISPIIDVFVQWIPRFMYPNKRTYEHLQEIAMGLGNSQVAFDSATSQPFFAEYFAMAGWPGVFIGIVLFGLALTSMLKALNSRYGNSDIGLICKVVVLVFFCYYYYSRGSIGQISKGFVFSLLPLLLLVRKQPRKV